MSVSSRERFLRQVKELHRLWTLSTDDLTVEQMNHRERDGVLPIAFTLLHYVRGEDRLICQAVLDEPTLWEAGNWAERIGGNPIDIRRGTKIVEAETATIGNAATWKDYQNTVFTHTESVLASLSDEDFEADKYSERARALPGELRRPGGERRRSAADVGPAALGHLPARHPPSRRARPRPRADRSERRELTDSMARRRTAPPRR